MIRIRCAEPADSPELCRLFREVPLKGAISLAHGRDPDFFTALQVEGRDNQVAVVLDEQGINTVAVRSIRPVYIDGSPVELGYLHGLRSREGRSRFGRGFLFVKGLHEQDRRVPAYLITVISDDAATRTMFEKRRGAFPSFEPFGDIITHAIPLPVRRRARRHGGTVAAATPALVPELIRFLNERFALRQFAPALDASDFERFAGLGLGPESFLVCMDGDRVTGMIGLWDQSAFKQCMVGGYNGWIGVARPIINAALSFGGLQPMPSPGKTLNLVYGCFIAVKDDDPMILTRLLDEASERLSGTGRHFLVVGLHEQDPLLPALAGRRSVKYRSTIYLGGWDDGAAFCRTVSRKRIPHLEVGML
jgi:hypothetical protein